MDVFWWEKVFAVLFLKKYFSTVDLKFYGYFILASSTILFVISVVLIW